MELSSPVKAYLVCVAYALLVSTVLLMMCRNRFILQKHRALHDTILGMC